MTDSQNDIGAPRQPDERARFVPPPAMREDVFNEVIYGLGLLMRTFENTQYEDYKGVQLALEYVKAMVDAEA